MGIFCLPFLFLENSPKIQELLEMLLYVVTVPVHSSISYIAHRPIFALSSFPCPFSIFFRHFHVVSAILSLSLTLSHTRTKPTIRDSHTLPCAFGTRQSVCRLQVPLKWPFAVGRFSGTRQKSCRVPLARGKKRIELDGH
jgi:hypothetical protein